MLNGAREREKMYILFRVISVTCSSSDLTARAVMRCQWSGARVGVPGAEPKCQNFTKNLLFIDWEYIFGFCFDEPGL